MIEIRPFPAIIYNYDKVGSPHKVICPPYDIISSIKEKSYRRLSRYNMIHLTLPCEALDENRYQKAAQSFRKWLGKGVFLRDKEPAIYFYEQEFKIGQIKDFPGGRRTRFTPHLFSSSNGFVRDKGAGFRRLGFIACLNLHNSSSIYGHEHTRIEPKEDRFKLLVKAQANLEPIFMLFSDPRGFLQDVFKKYVLPNKPLICFQDQEKNMNTLWRLTKPDILKKMKTKMANKILFIADGHHRYEVSLNYQDMMRKRLKRRDEDFNYIMVYFCPIQSKGLLVKSSIDLKEILRMAKLGKKFPAKTTYFYPKVPSGLVIYKFR